jgi:hypothetical protein
MERVESIDLFGETVVTEFRKTPAPKGYPATPGTGPIGETCKSCEFACGTGHSERTYYKCELLRKHWSRGPGTDIVLKSPACRFWEKEEPLPKVDVIGKNSKENK